MKDGSDLSNTPTILQPTAEFGLLYYKVLILDLSCAWTNQQLMLQDSVGNVGCIA